jgi:hypothetical protein
MKTLISLVIALALILPVSPAITGDASARSQESATFHVLSRLPAVEHAALIPLPDDQLATVEAGEVSLEIGASLILFLPSDFPFPSPSTCPFAGCPEPDDFPFLFLFP